MGGYLTGRDCLADHGKITFRKILQKYEVKVERFRAVSCAHCGERDNHNFCVKRAV
jgi:hypothetical protein